MSSPFKLDIRAVEKAFLAGVRSFGVQAYIPFNQWAVDHFYLSKESSYVEQKWQPWPFQRAIMAWMASDKIQEVNMRKSARVGYTKMLLACVCYNAHHRRRNQALWQPTDDDRDEFVKTELNPALRDVAVMADVLSSLNSRDKDNTLQQKKFKGSMLHLRGAKAAKNFRRISVDIAYADEYSAWDANIEKEGDGGDLMAKRLEGATFPKAIFGSTPKMEGFDNLQKRERNAEALMKYHIKCPHCGEPHPIEWGGKDASSGFKWVDNDPATVKHLCPHCGVLITQAEYLKVAEDGFYQCEKTGVISDHEGNFTDAAGNAIQPPRHVACHIWTAYSPNVGWDKIVREFLEAHQEMQEGKAEKMQTFTNTTLGNYWAQDIEKNDATELSHRAEPYRLDTLPQGCLILLAGVDTQDNRLECVVWGFGRKGEMWTIATRIFWGNPSQDQVWQELEEFLFEQEFQHISGQSVKIHATAIDSKGHNTHAVYAFAHKHRNRRVFAVAGRNGKEKHIKDGVSKVDIDWRGKLMRHGCMLWWVGTNHAKDLFYNRLQITQPGAGYVHFSDELSPEFYKQLAGEQRATRKTKRGDYESAWMATRKRVEALDCTVYVLWLEHHLELHKKSTKWWDDLEDKVQPKEGDLFGMDAEHTQPQPQARAKKPPLQPRENTSNYPQQGNRFASNEWLERR